MPTISAELIGADQWSPFLQIGKTLGLGSHVPGMMLQTTQGGALLAAGAHESDMSGRRTAPAGFEPGRPIDPGTGAGWPRPWPEGKPNPGGWPPDRPWPGKPAPFPTDGADDDSEEVMQPSADKPEPLPPVHPRSDVGTGVESAPADLFGEDSRSSIRYDPAPLAPYPEPAGFVSMPVPSGPFVAYQPFTSAAAATPSDGTIPASQMRAFVESTGVSWRAYQV